MRGTAIWRVVAVPFGLLAVAFLAVFLIGMLNLLDAAGRVIAGWSIATVWVLAPVAGGLASRRLTDREINVGGVLLALLVAACLAYVLLHGGSTADSCPREGLRDFGLFVAGLLVVAVLVGAGVGASTVVTARLSRSRVGLAIVLGGGLSLAANAGAYALLYSVVICLIP